jgi:ElaB/YqjD/DUF883 family membrane-anchored ribosome-binding protein
MALTQKLNIYDTNLGQVLRFIAGPPKVKITGPDRRASLFEQIPLKYEIRLSEEAYKVLQENPLLKQKIQIDMIQVGRAIVRNRIIPIMQKPQQITPQFKSRVEAALKQGETDVNNLVDSVLKRHAEMNKAWGDYYKGMRKDLIFVAVGIGLSVASIALAVPTGGASLALTIAGGARAIAGAVNKLGDCWRTAEEQQQRIHKSINVLLQAYLRSVHQGRAMQISGAMLDTIGVLPVIEMLPFVRQQLLPSMTKIQADMAIYKGKLGSLYEAANRLAAQLFDLLDQIEEWKKQNPGETMPKLAKIEEKISELLDSGVRKLRFRHKLTVSGAYSRYETGMRELEKLNQVIVQINGIERHPRAIQIINTVIKVLGNLAYAGAGYGASVPQFDGAADTVSISSTIASDTIGTVNDFIEFGQTVKGDAPPSQVQQVAQQVSATFAKMPVTVPLKVPPPTGKFVQRPLVSKVTPKLTPTPTPTPTSGPRRLAPLRPGV